MRYAPLALAVLVAGCFVADEADGFSVRNECSHAVDIDLDRYAANLGNPDLVGPVAPDRTEFLGLSTAGAESVFMEVTDPERDNRLRFEVEADEFEEGPQGDFITTIQREMCPSRPRRCRRDHACRSRSARRRLCR